MKATQKEVLDNNDDSHKNKKKATATLRETFGFVWRCGWKTRLLLVSGTLGGITHGLALPAVAYFLSTTFETISRVSGEAREETLGMMAGAVEDPLESIREISYTFLVLGVYTLACAFLETASFELMAVHATRLFQTEWFTALLRQDAAYFDIHASSSNTAPTSILRYQQGVGRRLGELIQNVTTGIAGVCLGLYSSWKVSLLVFAILPLISAASLNWIRVNQSKTQRAQECYQQANATAYFTVSSLRTVLSLNALPTMIQRYTTATQQALESASAVLAQLGFFGGAVMAAVICLFVGVILFGSYVMYDDVQETGCNPAGGQFGCDSTGTDIFQAMMGILFAGQALSQVGNCLEALTEARVAAKEALKVIQRRQGSPAKTFYKKETTTTKASETRDEEDSDPMTEEEARSVTTTPSPTPDISAVLPEYQIDPFSPEGIVPERVQGSLEFKDVTFSYPSRPGVSILQNFSLAIPAGKTVALVGPSGGGKSTVLSLIERFYDPLEGSVSLDGVDIKDLNLAHYRKTLGYVGQEPSLFATTIRENIAYGASNPTQEDIERAAKMANAHDDFITSLPDGYDTQVGDKGAQLSGGQKQRIAIARVLIGKPKILCLDEATSALDAESELYVQHALDNILEQGSMTAVIVAHRLSTIRKADLIYVIAGGGVVESGTHEELMQSEAGHYRQLVEKQEGKPEEQEQAEETPVSASASMNPTNVQRAVSASSDDKLETSQLPPPSSDDNFQEVALEPQTPLLEFRNVDFAYPSRPTKQILKKFNLSVMPGETLALVGPSGGGKSTTVGLIERFYDPADGVLLYKGHDVKTLNNGWYRDQIGYVGQEPTLFPGTIGENIAFGAPGATQEMIEEAARQANIHDFVMSTPDKYNTSVGENGGQLSGGQKQRVAIARALIKKPPILLLDEATSALDNDSEAIVQEALDKLMQSHKHTVVVIAHKLSTIRGCADRIAVVGSGEVLEIGSHDELIVKKHGHYQRLVEAQKRQTSLHTLGMSKALKKSSSKKKMKSGDDNDMEQDKADKDAKKGKDDAEDKAAITKSIAQRVKALAKPDLGYIAVGSVGALLAGAAYPMLGLLFAESINLLFFQVAPCWGDNFSPLLGFDTCEEYWDDAADEMQAKSFYISLYYGLLVVSTMIGSIGVYWGFGKASERLSKRLRDDVFTALVRQEPGFFDVRQIGELTTQLQESTARMHAFSGSPIRQFIIAVSSVVIGILVSFVVMWPYALMCIACMVPMSFAAKLRAKKTNGEDLGSNEGDTTSSAGAIMVETLLNMRTISALGLEHRQQEAYRAAVLESQQNAKRDSAISGVMAGVGHFIQRWSNALLYFWGGWLLLEYPEMFEFQDFLISQFSFIFCTLGLAAALQDVDDRSEVEASAKWIFDILDRRSAIDPLSKEGDTVSADGNKKLGETEDYWSRVFEC